MPTTRWIRPPFRPRVLPPVPAAIQALTPDHPSDPSAKGPNSVLSRRSSTTSFQGLATPEPTFDPTPFLVQDEGQHFERKSLFAGPDSHKRARDRREVRDQIAKVVASFANAEGGVLILGLEDDGSLTGHRYPPDAVAAMLAVPRARLLPAQPEGFAYEFQAIDQPLDERAQRDLRDISSRATITATSFANTYSWGDLRGDPAQMLARWFDAFLHVANWGTRWLAFRVPRAGLTPEDLAPYEAEIFSAQHHENHTCLHFHLQPEDGGGDWLDGEELLGSLLPLREALGTGDRRCLYLAWLVDVHWGALDAEEEEPPVPPGLNNLDAPHRAFVAFMGVDPDLLAVAAEASAPLEPRVLTPTKTRAWLAGCDATEKDAWLLQVIEGNGAQVRWDLRKRLRDDLARPVRAERSPRTVGELMQRAEARTAARLEQEQHARAERLRRQAAARAEARQRHLDSIAGRESELWQQVEALIGTCKPKSYDEAVDLVRDLRDLAVRAGERTTWEARFSALRTAHHRKSSLIRRLEKVTAPQTHADRSR